MIAAMQQDSGANAQGQKIGAYRGKFRYLRWCTGPAAATYYDNIAIDGRKHVVINFVALTATGFNPVPQPNGYAAAKYILAVDTGIAA